MRDVAGGSARAGRRLRDGGRPWGRTLVVPPGTESRSRPDVPLAASRT